MATSTVITSKDIKTLAQENITMHVKFRGQDGWRRRLKVADWLIRLAAWVAWMNIEIDDNNDNGEPECQP